MFFLKKPLPRRPALQKIEVFVRHCVFSKASAHKKRPDGFSRELCHRNLIETSDSRVNITSLLDTAIEGGHFLKNKADIEISEGTEAGSFLRLLDHVEKLDLDPDTIVYFLEDDYLHRPGWVDILLEGFSLPADYVTLYDHRDKYFYPMYKKLKSEIFVSSSCHWRTTPSTTNTFAVRAGTLREDLSSQRKFSLKRKITADHDKFLYLQKQGRVLISSIPGYSTHAEPEYASPCINWEPYFKENLCSKQ